MTHKQRKTLSQLQKLVAIGAFTCALAFLIAVLGIDKKGDIPTAIIYPVFALTSVSIVILIYAIAKWIFDK